MRPESPAEPTGAPASLQAPDRASQATLAHGPRKRGRPLEMSAQEVLRAIRQRFEEGTLFRVHVAQPGLYARARRLFGSWARALAAAGIDHARALAEARRRALDTRRRARPPASR